MMPNSSAELHDKIMITKPPRAPCWRDFMPENNKTKKSSGGVTKKTSTVNETLLPSDLVLSHRCSSEGSDPPRTGRSTHASKSGSKSGLKLDSPNGSIKGQRRIKSTCTLRRTDSHITLGNLPRIENTTISLADTDPRAIGVKIHDEPIDEEVYLQDNTKRCEEWLETVQASRPFATDWDFVQGSGDEIEIPEETWVDFGELGKSERRQKVKKNSSSSKSTKSRSSTENKSLKRSQKLGQKDNKGKYLSSSSSSDEKHKNSSAKTTKTAH